MRTPSHNQPPDFYEEIPADEPADGGTAEPEDENVSEDAPEDDQSKETPHQEEQQIPKGRFDKVYAESKEAQRKLSELEAQIEDLTKKNQPAQSQEEQVALEAEAEKAIKQLLQREGYADSKDEITKLKQEWMQERANTELKSDARELGAWAKEQGYPKLDLEKLGEYAKDNNIAITSKSALKSAYLAQNMDAIITAAAKRGQGASEAPKATVEKPGAGSGKAPSAPDKGPKTIQERIREAAKSLNMGS